MNILSIKSSDPEHFEETMRPAAGPVFVRPAQGTRFSADIKLACLNKLATFTINGESMKVRAEPPHDFYSVTIPLGISYSVYEQNRQLTFKNNSAHVLHHDRLFDFTCQGDCRVLCVNVSTNVFLEMSYKLNANDAVSKPYFSSSISTLKPEGSAFLRSLARLWSELRHCDAGSIGSIAIQEYEDDIISNMVLASQLRQSDCHEPVNHKLAALAEDYLTSRLTQAMSRAELADATGISVRTLSRWFVKRHGIGPTQFLKQRRLDAAYAELLSADAEETNVTDIAVRYGFNHLGRFAIEYKKVFNESPSETLRH